MITWVLILTNLPTKESCKDVVGSWVCYESVGYESNSYNFTKINTTQLFNG